MADMPKIPGLDALLNGLNDLDEIGATVSVIVAKRDSKYLMQCFVPGQGSDTIRGETVKPLHAFFKASLPRVYEAMSKELDRSGLVFRDDAAGIVGKSHAQVAFVLDAMRNDPYGYAIISVIQNLYKRVADRLLS